MLTRKLAEVSQLPASLNFFNAKMQLDANNTSAEISIAGTNSTIKVYLKVSVTGNVFVLPHADAAITLLAGTRTVVIPFSGLTPGMFVELWLYKQDATEGTVSAALI